MGFSFGEPLALNGLKALAGLGMYGLEGMDALKPPNNGIHGIRIKLDPISLATYFFAARIPEVMRKWASCQVKGFWTVKIKTGIEIPSASE